MAEVQWIANCDYLVDDDGENILLEDPVVAPATADYVVRAKVNSWQFEVTRPKGK